MVDSALEIIPGPTDLNAMRTGLVTVCVMLLVWLGLLARPSRAMLYFTLGFVLALLGTYASMVSAAVGVNTNLHPVGIGIAFGAPMLLWSGIRVFNDRRAHPYIGFVQSALSVVALSLTTNTSISFDVFRWLFLGAGIGAAMGGIELLRGSYRTSRFSSPLIGVSFGALALGVVGVLPSVLPGNIDNLSNLLFLRNATITSSLYLVCATVSLLFLANRRPGARDVLEAIDAFMPAQLFGAMARERLQRAAMRHENSWTLVDLRIDDAADIRAATGDVAFGSITHRFESIVASTLPAEADLGRVAPGHVLMLVAHSGRSVRDLVREILTAFSADDASSPISVRISASAGIVPVAVGVDTSDSLIASASRAAAAAQSKGGDQWTLLEPRATIPTPLPRR